MLSIGCSSQRGEAGGQGSHHCRLLGVQGDSNFLYRELAEMRQHHNIEDKWGKIGEGGQRGQYGSGWGRAQGSLLPGRAGHNVLGR